LVFFAEPGYMASGMMSARHSKWYWLLVLYSHPHNYWTSFSSQQMMATRNWM